MPENSSTPYYRLTRDMDKVMLMRRVIVQRAATQDGIFLGQLPALEYIHRNPDCSQKDVADFMGVSPPSMAVMVKRMIRDGLIEKRLNPEDMRQNHLRTTARGGAISTHNRALYDQLDRQAYQGFSPEELEQLANYLDRLINNLANSGVSRLSNFALMQLMQEMHHHPKLRDQSEKED